jgi:hypothetical protein
MPTSTDDAKMNTVLSMLAGESSDYSRTEPMAVAIGQNLGEEIWKPEGAHRKRSRQANHPVVPGEERKKKRRLRRLSWLEQDAGPSTLLLGDGPVSTILEDDVRGCDDARVVSGVLDDEEEEEEEVLLILKNSRRNRGNDILMQALSALVCLQGLSISDFDHALEEIIPEKLLSEPPMVDNPIIRLEDPDDVPLSCDPVGQEATRTVSCASSTLEGGLAREDALAFNIADLSHLAPLGMTEGALALEVAATEGPAPEGGAGGDPAPEGVGAGSYLAASMDVHVGSPPLQSEELATTHLSAALAGLVTLEVSDLDARSLPPAGEAEDSPSHAFAIVPADIPSTSSALILWSLGLPLFLSNLQVNQLLFLTVHASKLAFLLTFFVIARCS